jgi:TPR repeat protein
MGDCYVQGKGVGRNLDEAERWYLAAIQQGWKQAEASLQRVRDERAKKRP